MSRIKADPEAWKRVIESMLDEKDYQFASETLEGIWETIDNSGKITSNQINAIQNIRRSADRI